MSFIETIMQNPLWQTFWFIAMAIAFMALLQKDDKKTLKIIIISMIFWVLHFYTMEVYSTLAATIIWIFRIFLSLKYKKNKRIFLWIVSATIVFWIITFENNYSILPIIGSIISAYWYFFFERIRLRLFMFVTSMFWFTFHISTWSMWWILNEIIVQLLLVIAMYKMIIEEWKRVYFVDKVMWILKKPKPDVGRYINIYDFIKIKHKNFIQKIKSKFKKELKKDIKIVKNEIEEYKKSS